MFNNSKYNMHTSILRPSTTVPLEKTTEKNIKNKFVLII